MRFIVLFLIAACSTNAKPPASTALQLDANRCSAGGVHDRAPASENPEDMPSCSILVYGNESGKSINCCYERREDACAAIGCAPDACVIEPALWARPRCETPVTVR
jgi:hypothetical protein